MLSNQSDAVCGSCNELCPTYLWTEPTKKAYCRAVKCGAKAFFCQRQQTSLAGICKGCECDTARAAFCKFGSGIPGRVPTLSRERGPNSIIRSPLIVFWNRVGLSLYTLPTYPPPIHLFQPTETLVENPKTISTTSTCGRTFIWNTSLVGSCTGGPF